MQYHHWPLSPQHRGPELHVRLPQQQVRFPELLRESGYYTVLSGKNHMFGNKDRAFDRITGGGGPGKEEDWVGHVKNRPKDKPFSFGLHRPMQHIVLGALPKKPPSMILRM